MLEFVKSANGIMWSYVLLVILCGTGVYFTVRLKFIQVRKFGEGCRLVFGHFKLNGEKREHGEMTPLQSLATAIAAQVGTGNLTGAATALISGGPGAIFWMWVSAIVGMSTKYHEGVLAIKYRSRDAQGRPLGGPMHIIRNAMPHRWRPLAALFATAGMFGTLCIMNANQLTEATLSTASHLMSIDNPTVFKTITGLVIATIVGLVVVGGVKRIARVASVLVPFMVSAYFLMVLYIIVGNIDNVPGVLHSIFSEAFSLRAGWGGLAGIAIIGARRAALVNDAGVGTASIMHGTSSNREPVREGLVAMLGPAIDSGFVCTLTALAILLCGDISASGDSVKGLAIALDAFGSAIPYGEYLLMAIVCCFAMSSMFSYSFYGGRCAHYLFGDRGTKVYTWFFILTLVVFAVIPLSFAVGLCDLFYALMAFPTMLTLFMLRNEVKAESTAYFAKEKESGQELIKEDISY